MPRKELTTVVNEPGKNGSILVEVTLPVRLRRREADQTGAVAKSEVQPPIPRITRLMALAIKFQDMVNRGEVQDYADLARLGYVTRARLTQIMNLLLLAPGIQEQILFMGVSQGISRAATERELRPVAAVIEWEEQQRQFTNLRAFACPSTPTTPLVGSPPQAAYCLIGR